MELFGHLTMVPNAPEVQLTKLDFGDIMFSGNSSDGLISVGIEYKTVNDVLNCVKDGRFAGFQLPGMMANYEVCYLLMEGKYSSGRDGRLFNSARRGGRSQTGIPFSSLLGWLTTMETNGVQVSPFDLPDAVPPPDSGPDSIRIGTVLFKVRYRTDEQMPLYMGYSSYIRQTMPAVLT